VKRARSTPALLLGLALLLFALGSPAAAQASFGIASLNAEALNEDGSTDLQAGSHPYEFRLFFEMNQDSQGRPEGTLRELTLDLPAGMVGDPFAVPRCPGAAFEGPSPVCPGDSQVGVALIHITGLDFPTPVPIYNLTPPLGVPAMIGLSIANNNSFQEASLRPQDYGVRISDLTIPTSKQIQSVEAEVWGAPAAAGHDPDRFCILNGELVEGCASNIAPAPFLTMPTSCGDALEWTLRVKSVQEPDVFQSASVLSESEGAPAGLEGCNALEFDPSISSQPTTNLSDSPSGLDFDLHIPQPPAVEQAPGSPDVCFRGVWSGEPSAYEFQWLRNGAPIPGPASPAYQLQAADSGTALQCEVRAINGAPGPGRAVSPPLVISPQPSTAPPTAGTPAIKVSEGTATCDPGKWGGTPTFAYQWFEDGAIVPGQAENTYTPGPAPYTLQCLITATTAGGTVLAYSANRSSEPPPEPPLPEASVQPRASLDEDALPLATAHLKDTTVVLPEGMTLNPSSAGGLAACSEAEIGYLPEAGHYTGSPQHCPDASKIGTVEATSPLVDHTLAGAVYVATPYQNPFGSLTAIYLAVEDEQTGTIVKLGGEARLDPRTGQITNVFRQNPQLPIEDISLHVFKGPRAILKTPLACATHTTTSTLIPWSSPEGQTVNPSDSFQTSVAAGGGGSCPKAEAPNTPAFTAGTLAPEAGAYSPFVLKLSRADGSQRLRQVETTLPPGLAGKLAGIATCPEAAIAQAQAREVPNQGALEIASPSCPPTSELGSVTVGAGAGISPYFVGAHAYLAGPYKAAPLSIVVIAPAVAGPFDLGTVVSRVALAVDPGTAQITATSDPLPSMLQGIELDVRSIAIDLDRPGFTLNPTDCSEMAIAGTAISTLGSPAPLVNRFQVGGCSSLKFAPRFSLRLKGPVKRTANPKLIADVTYPKRGAYSNVARAQVKLPSAAFIDNAHIGTVCTRPQFAAHHCPPRSVIGRVSATSPLLGYPVKGNVYLRSSTHPLPDLVAELRGPDTQPIEVDLVGKTDSVNGALRNTFEAAPDVPVSHFRLELFGGKRGLIEMSSGFCKHPNATIRLRAHNEATYNTHPRVQSSCGKSGKKRSHRLRSSQR
jgi:hypothetical protein